MVKSEWSFEGQWILKFSATNKQAANLLNSGSICPSIIPTSMKAMTHVVTTWGKFWDHSKKLLVEKSPQALLKIASLRRIFSSARSVKYVVVVKHPVTLNVALPREYDWLTHKESVKSYRAKEATARAQGMTRAPPRTEFSNNKAEIIHNARHFVQFMTTNQTQTTASNGKNNCIMGWLEVMEQLQRDLETDPRNLEEVRIIRFEDFGRPHFLCRSLFQFVFGQHGIQEARMAKQNVCDRYLAPSVVVQNTRPHGHRRKLRLIGSSEKPGVEFSHITFDRSTQQRIQQYQKAYTYFPSDVKLQLKAINARLKVFGYSLDPGKEYRYKSEISVFKPWQLLQ